MRKLGSNIYLPVLIALAAIIVLPFFFQTNYHYRVATLVMINGLAVLGLVVLLGYAGLASLGHAGFFGIGAYVCAILPDRFGIHPVLALAAGTFAATIAGWAIGRPILRLKGPYLAIVTLAFGVLVTLVAGNERWLTGGSDGMAVQVPAVRQIFQVLGLRLSTPAAWYWLIAPIALIGMYVAINLRHSASGRALVALHGSDVAAGTLGVDVAKEKLAAFTIASAYAGLAGALFAQFNEFVDPSAAHLLHSVEFLTMAVLGGATSVSGAMVGAAMLTLLPQVLTFVREYEQTFIGLIMMATMVFLGRGLVPSLLALRKGNRHG